MPLIISPEIAIPDDEFEWKFIRASGPGGQNVNKVSSAVQLRFLLPQNTSLPVAARNRLRRIAGQKINDDGTIPVSYTHLDVYKRQTADIPVLSEESAQAPWSERKSWKELWVVDPLDGTREFVKRNGEFTINIALVVDHEPLLGLISAPAQGLLYWGARGVGAFSRHRDAAERRIQVSPPHDPIRVVGSRSHASVETCLLYTSLPRAPADYRRRIGYGRR